MTLFIIYKLIKKLLTYHMTYHIVTKNTRGLINDWRVKFYRQSYK